MCGAKCLHSFYSEGAAYLDCAARVVVENDTIVPFKRILDRYINMQGMEGYESRADRGA